MNYAKQATKKMCESISYDFLNEYHFDIKMKEAFERYFITELKEKVNNRNTTWISHRNYLLVLAYKNGYSTTYIASMFGCKHCNVLHNIRTLTERLEFRDSLTMTARMNVAKFLKSYSRDLSKEVLINNYDFEAENQKHFDNGMLEMIVINQLEIKSNYKNGVLPFVGKFDHSSQFPTTALSKY